MPARFLRVTKLASMPAGNQTVPPLSLQLPQGLSLSPSAKPLNSALTTGLGAGGVIQNFASGCAGCFLFFLFFASAKEAASRLVPAELASPSTSTLPQSRLTNLTILRATYFDRLTNKTIKEVALFVTLIAMAF